MKRLGKNLLTVFRHLKWERSATGATPILFFGDYGYRWVKKIVPGLPDIRVLSIELSQIVISFRIVFEFVAGLAHFRDPELQVGSVGFRLYSIYLLAVVRSLRPRVVITFFDNHECFHWLARVCEHSVFCALQNGYRPPHELDGKIEENRSRYFHLRIPHYFCFGQGVIDLIEGSKHEVKHYYPYGSLIGGYFFSAVERSAPTECDLAYVSQWESRIMLHGDRPSFYRGFTELTTMLARYVAETGVRLRVALRTDFVEEQDFFRATFGANVVLDPCVRENFSVYRLINRADVTVGLNSTAILEGFGAGKKSLFVNNTGNPGYTIRPTGMWALENVTYPEFAQALDKVRKLTPGAYWSQAQSAARYNLVFDEQHLISDELGAFFRLHIPSAEYPESTRGVENARPASKVPSNFPALPLPHVRAPEFDRHP